MTPANILKVVLLIADIGETALRQIAKYRELIATARAEGRDITDEELRLARWESQRLHDEWMARLAEPEAPPDAPLSSD